jgi:hypothetical protein
MLSLVLVVMSSREEVNLLFYLQINEKGIKMYEENKNKKLREMALQLLKDPINKKLEIELTNMEEIKTDKDIENQGHNDDFEHLLIVCKNLITRSAIEHWASIRFALLTFISSGWLFNPIFLVAFTAFGLCLFYYFDSAVKHDII